MQFKTLFELITFRLGIHQGYFSASTMVNFNLKFLKKVPVIKLFFHEKFFMPLFLPRSWSTEGLLEFYRRNFIVWLGSIAGQILMLSELELSGGFYGVEMASPRRPSPMINYNVVLNYRLEW
jgi:hypothetical protein